MPAKRLICSLALLVGIVLGGLGAVSAEGNDAAREACAPDATRLCNEFIPDETKVKSCMLSKRSQLSQACRLAMHAKPEEGERHYHRRRHSG